LAPANGTYARYKLQEWLAFISTELHKNFSPLFTPGMPEEAKIIFKARLMDRLKWVDSALAGTTWLMSDTFTVADAYLFNVSNWTRFVGVDISALENLAALRTRVSARPAVQEAMRAEGLIK
jgi:glutathione S-transferase